MYKALINFNLALESGETVSFEAGKVYTEAQVANCDMSNFEKTEGEATATAEETAPVETTEETAPAAESTETAPAGEGEAETTAPAGDSDNLE